MQAYKEAGLWILWPGAGVLSFSGLLEAHFSADFMRKRLSSGRDPALQGLGGAGRGREA